MFKSYFLRCLLDPLAPVIAGSVTGQSPLAPVGVPVVGPAPEANSQEGAQTLAAQPDPGGDDMAGFEQIAGKIASAPLTDDPSKETRRPAPKAQSIAEPAPIVAPKAVDTTVAPAPPKVEPSPVVDKTKIDATKIPFIAKPVATPAVTNTANPPVKIERDLTGLNEEEQKAFKNMSLEAYALVRPAFDEAKKLKTERIEYEKQINELKARPSQPTGAMDHPQGYILNPEFQQRTRDSQRLAWEANYHQEQLAKVRAGEPYVPLVGINEQGNYIPGQPQAPTPQAEAQLVANMGRASQLKQQVDGEMQQIAQWHQQNHGQFQQQLEQMLPNYFPFYFEGGDQNPHKAKLEKAVKELPPQFQGTPFSKFMAYGNTLISDLANQLNEANAELATLRAGSVKAEAAKAGPVAGASGAGGSLIAQQQAEDADFDAFIKATGISLQPAHR